MSRLFIEERVFADSCPNEGFQYNVNKSDQESETRQ